MCPCSADESAVQMDPAISSADSWCPGAQPDAADAVVFAVRNAVDGVRVGYLASAVKVTPEVLSLVDEVDPLEVFRIGAPCAGSGCVHFAADRCGLAARISAEVPAAVDIAPACSLRSTCRWFSQEGTAACLRCPAILTLESGRNAAVVGAANPR